MAYRRLRITQGLKKLFRNFDKMIKFEKNNLRRNNQERNDVEELKEEFIREHNILKQNRENYASYIDSVIENQRYMSSQIQNTDYLIMSKLQLEQRKYESIVTKAKTQAEREERKREEMDRRMKVSAELLEYKRKYQQLKDVFSLEENDNFDIEKIESTPQFKQFLAHLNIRKTLNQEIIENDIRVKDLRRRVNDLDIEKKVDGS